MHFEFQISDQERVLDEAQGADDEVDGQNRGNFGQRRHMIKTCDKRPQAGERSGAADRHKNVKEENRREFQLSQIRLLNNCLAETTVNQ